MACPRCETERAAEKLFCRHCFDIFAQPRKIGRLRRWLGLGPREPAERIVAPEPKSDDFETRLAELARDAIHEATRAGGPAEPEAITRAKDEAGDAQIYESVDETSTDLPPAVREALAKSGD